MNTKELQQELEERGATASGWFDHLGRVNMAVQEAGGDISFDCAGAELTTVMATYYSPAIGRSVIVDWNVGRAFESIDELAELIVDYENKIEQVERDIANA